LDVFRHVWAAFLCMFCWFSGAFIQHHCLEIKTPFQNSSPASSHTTPLAHAVYMHLHCSRRMSDMKSSDKSL
jgi:hypothetical protein